MKLDPEYKQLLNDAKEYISLRYDLLRLEVLEKLSLILSLFILIVVSVMLALVAFVYFSLAFAYYLKSLLGSMTPGLCIIGGIFILMLILIALLRKQLIINPLIKHVSKILFKDNDNHNGSDNSKI
ncbi:MAG: hypothetical protein EOL95_05710 [Bacteroidia bacterium]|nr:hypothetical protein [Bacteroidia bacterium]